MKLFRSKSLLLLLTMQPCILAMELPLPDTLAHLTRTLNALTTTLQQSTQTSRHQQLQQPGPGGGDYYLVPIGQPTQQPYPTFCPPQQQAMIARDRFVEDILGIDEDTFRRIYGWTNERLYNHRINGVLSRIPRNTKDWILAYHRRAAIFQGKFSIQSVGQLEQQLTQHHNSGKPYFTINLYDPHYEYLSDIRYLQSLPENKLASFQIASTFFGPLEGGMVKFDNKLHDMLERAVQGEEASIATAGATIWRKYFMPTFNNNKYGFGYYYLLYNLKNKLPFEMGRHAPKIGDKAAANYTPAAIRDNEQAFNHDIRQVNIGNHTNIVVTSGYGKINLNDRAAGDQQQMAFGVDQLTGGIIPEQAQLIHHIFTAAHSLNKRSPINQNEKTLARMLLQAAYLGTVKTARLNTQFGSSRLFLTLVGGGSFKNPIDTIGEAIKKTEQDIKDGGLQVTLVFRPDSPDKTHAVRDKAGDAKFLKDMIRMMDRINKTNLQADPNLNAWIDTYLTAAYTTKDSDQQSLAAQAITAILQGRPAALNPAQFGATTEEGWVTTHK